ncbi:MAG: nickel pincer cofactor biosynthesis protein LarB [Spirochaetales bacterium]|nr:nickel pincer cofactor biosynthesis protein LarB [Spirochaetales bacterium]
MWQKTIKDLLERVYDKTLTPEDAEEEFKKLISHDLGFAEIDTSRHIRTGFPEVVYCASKKDEEVLAIVRTLFHNETCVLCTRAKKTTFSLLKKEFKKIEFFTESGSMIIGNVSAARGTISVISAGTSDIPVAQEAAVTAKAMGAEVKTYWDIGIAGIHRLFAKLEKLRESNAIVAVAGMDGALPGVIAGLVPCPVIAVPTSVGYGASFQGLAPLLTMLNSCAPGVSVVNIDNGFGAGYIAALINHRIGIKK